MTEKAGFSRREFLKFFGVAAASAGLTACGINPDSIEYSPTRTLNPKAINITPTMGRELILENPTGTLPPSTTPSPKLSETLEPEPTAKSEVRLGNKRVLILGDSFIEGKLPDKIAETLNDCKVEFVGGSTGVYDSEVKREDLRGAKIADIARDLLDGEFNYMGDNARAVEDYGRVDILVLQVGTNDLVHGREAINNQSGPKLNEIVNYFWSRNEHLTVILGEVPHTLTKSDIYVDDINAVFKKEAEYLANSGLDIRLISFGDFDPQVDINKGDAEHPDGVHPNDHGTRVMANSYSKALREALEGVCPTSS